MSAAEFGVWHPDDRVSVRIDGHPFPFREAAAEEAARSDTGGEFGHCEFCGADAKPGGHQVVTRTPGQWLSA